MRFSIIERVASVAKTGALFADEPPVVLPPEVPELDDEEPVVEPPEVNESTAFAAPAAPQPVNTVRNVAAKRLLKEAIRFEELIRLYVKKNNLSTKKDILQVST
jgi:hypothetical protein